MALHRDRLLSALVPSSGVGRTLSDAPILDVVLVGQKEGGYLLFAIQFCCARCAGRACLMFFPTHG